MVENTYQTLWTTSLFNHETLKTSLPTPRTRLVSRSAFLVDTAWGAAAGALTREKGRKGSSQQKAVSPCHE